MSGNLPVLQHQSSVRIILGAGSTRVTSQQAIFAFPEAVIASAFALPAAFEVSYGP